MVDLSGGPDGPIEHGFSNSVFIIPGIIIMGLADVDPQLDPEAMPPGGEDFLTPEKVLAMLNQLEEMPEEDREELRQQLLSGQMGMGMQGFLPEQSSFGSQALLLISMLAVVTFILVFFSYKLYKSLIEKERKRDEKRKMKQMKRSKWMKLQ